VFAGVLHRSDDELIGAAIGQTDNILADLGGMTLEDIKRGEIANIPCQAISPNSCRFTDNGKARPMNRDSPDDSRSGVTMRASPPLRQARREEQRATGASGIPTVVERADLTIFLSIRTHSSHRVILNA
jgi:hypothetical protein